MDLVGEAARVLKEVYQDKAFPIVWLLFFVGLTGLTADYYWIIPGIAGFVYFVWKRKDALSGLGI